MSKAARNPAVIAEARRPRIIPPDLAMQFSLFPGRHRQHQESDESQGETE